MMLHHDVLYVLFHVDFDGPLQTHSFFLGLCLPWCCMLLKQQHAVITVLY